MFKNIKKLLVYIIFSLLIVILYIELSKFWVGCGGVDGKNRYFELPIIIVFLAILYFPNKSLYKNIFFSVSSIIGIYVLYDVFYHYLARSPRFSDLENASVLNDFSLFMGIGFVIMVGIILAPYIYLIYQFSKSKLLSFIKILSFIGLFYMMGTSQFGEYLSKKFDYYNWSQSKTIKKNGRFCSFLYYSMSSKNYRKKLSLYKNKNIDVNKILFGDSILKNKPNIYIVILESFIDPRLIKDVKFDKSPLAEELKKYLINDDFSHVISPIYGGGTSQAEFEVLVGAKAFAKVGSIEFNVLEGDRISGFVDILRKNSYNTYATIATNSGYFNSKDAYRSIGFEDVVFLEESDDFLLNEEDEKIFDGDVYEYNIKKLKANALKKPYLHYTLGMYGHFPYDRNIAKRPDVINSSSSDERVQRIANQFYYRTRALAKYIGDIINLDPNSIIYVTSDHIPPLLTNGVKYTRSSTENISLLIVNKKAVNVNDEKYYNIPRVIYSTICNDDLDLKSVDEKIQEDIYFKVLSQGLKD